MSTGEELWAISLLIGLVVIAVVALLLHLVKKTAGSIQNTAADIWTQGKLTANNTIHIPLFLAKTNAVVSDIYQSAGSILAGSTVIKTHVNGCPGCPACVLGPHKTNEL